MLLVDAFADVNRDVNDGQSKSDPCEHDSVSFLADGYYDVGDDQSCGNPAHFTPPSFRCSLPSGRCCEF